MASKPELSFSWEQRLTRAPLAAGNYQTRSAATYPDRMTEAAVDRVLTAAPPAFTEDEAAALASELFAVGEWPSRSTANATRRSSSTATVRRS